MAQIFTVKVFIAVRSSLTDSFNSVFSHSKIFCLHALNSSMLSLKLSFFTTEKIPGNRTLILRNFLYFLKRKLFLYFGKQNPQKNYLNFRERNFLISFLKKVFLYFRKCIFRTLTDLELEAYSSPWYIQNTVKHLR